MAILEEKTVKIYSHSKNHKIPLKIIPGHFATSHSHINYYIDLTTLKTRQNEAAESAKLLTGLYVHSTIVDTIVCVDGMQVVGAYLAEELNRAGFMSINAHNTIYVVTPEYTVDGQMMFRDNIQPMLKGKNVILLMASVTTGETVRKTMDCVRYYSGIVQGVSAIFSAVKSVDGFPVNCIFDKGDLPEYASYPPHECPHCKGGEKIDALVNSFGYSAL